MNAGSQPIPTSKHKQKPDYGIDAPGVRRGMLIARLRGTVLAAIATGAQGFGLVGAGTASIVATLLTALGPLAEAYGFYMAAT